MKNSPRLRPPLAVLLLAAVFLLTGCFKTEANLVIDDQGYVSGDVVFGLDRTLVEQVQGFDPKFGEQDFFDDLAERGDLNVTIMPYEDADYVGQRATFQGATIEQVARTMSNDDDTFTLVRGDGIYTLTAVLQPFNKDTTAQPDAISEDPVGYLSITFPGPVRTANGTINGNTVTWDIAALSGGGELNATAEDAPTPTTSQGGGVPKLLLAGAGTLILVLAAAAAGLHLRRHAGTSTSANPQSPASSTDGVPSGSVGIAAGWYESSGELRWWDGTTWTEDRRPLSDAPSNIVVPSPGP